MKQILNESKEKMSKSIDSLAGEFSQLKAGRANPAILDKLTVEYYGAATPLTQLGSVSVPEAKTILIQPWDASVLGEIEKAILKSDIGINPVNDGKCIRLVFPALTEERRKELVKTVSKYSENAKVAVRNIRRDAMDKYKDMKKKSEITEDDLKGLEKEIQDATDAAIKKIDEVTAAKEKEIMTV